MSPFLALCVGLATLSLCIAVITAIFTLLSLKRSAATLSPLPQKILEPMKNLKSMAQTKFVDLAATGITRYLFRKNDLENQNNKEGKETTMAESRGWGPFILGGLIGAAVAILCAPEKGTDVRKRVKRWFEEGKEMGKDLETHLATAYKAGRKAFLENGSKKSHINVS
ncbi:MAG: YtxH domain-containing protein [Elusimicrobia bacterium]|nr:YtxH domain-containing protein [Elusimicrobiota bacterium]